MRLNTTKKVVEKKDIEKLEADIGSLRQAIELRKDMAKGGEDAVRMLVKYLESYQQTTRTLQQQCYREPSLENVNSSIRYAGELNALGFVLDLLTGSKAAVPQYQSELERLEKQLEEWKQYSVRE